MAYDPVTGLPKKGQQIVEYPSDYNIFAPVTGAAAAQPNTPGQVTPGQAPSQSGVPQVPGYGNYSQIIGNDPQYKQALADLSAQGIADDASAKAQALRALALFGQVPDFTGPDSSVLGPHFAEYAGEAKPLAEKATQEGLSIAARLEKQYKDNVRALKNSLAARGLLKSGETGYQLGEENQRYKEAGFDARTKLVDFLSGIEAGRAAAARQRAAAQASALGQAQQNAATYFPYGAGQPAAQQAGAAPVAPPPVAPPPNAPWHNNYVDYQPDPLKFNQKPQAF